MTNLTRKTYSTKELALAGALAQVSESLLIGEDEAIKRCKIRQEQRIETTVNREMEARNNAIGAIDAAKPIERGI